MVLDRDNFQDRVEEAGLVLIMFQADWCRHCKPLALTWEVLATQYRSQEVVMASVDCNAADNVNKELCSRLGVSGVPSIQIFRDGVKVESMISGQYLSDTSDWRLLWRQELGGTERVGRETPSP